VRNLPLCCSLHYEKPPWIFVGSRPDLSPELPICNYHEFNWGFRFTRFSYTAACVCLFYMLVLQYVYTNLMCFYNERSRVSFIRQVSIIFTRYSTAHFIGLFFYSQSKPIVNCICKRAAIWFCYVLLHVPCATVS